MKWKDAMRIIPGDLCKVMLEKFPSLDGRVETRTVSFDGTGNCTVEIVCVTRIDLGSDVSK